MNYPINKATLAPIYQSGQHANYKEKLIDSVGNPVVKHPQSIAMINWPDIRGNGLCAFNPLFVTATCNAATISVLKDVTRYSSLWWGRTWGADNSGLSSGVSSLKL